MEETQQHVQLFPPADGHAHTSLQDGRYIPHFDQSVLTDSQQSFAGLIQVHVNNAVFRIMERCHRCVTETEAL